VNRNQKKNYPFVAFRPSIETEKRLRGLSKRTGKGISELINHCVFIELPKIEAQLCGKGKP